MSDIITALEEIERELSQQKGPFTLFAVFERQDIPNRWDVLVAAPWAEQDEKQAVRLLAAELKKRIPQSEMTRVSRIIILSSDDASVRAITSARSVAAAPRTISLLAWTIHAAMGAVPGAMCAV